jgi:hypothetical protein
MTLIAKQLPGLKLETYESRPGRGVRVSDIFDAIHDKLSIVLTHHDKSRLAPQVERCNSFYERRRHSTRGEDKGMRWHDLLRGQVMFGGLEWIEPCVQYPEGAWIILFEHLMQQRSLSPTNSSATGSSGTSPPMTFAHARQPSYSGRR